MTFPQTRHTLIRRIALEGSEEDWRVFVTDYWGAVCQFAARRAKLSHQDAEDVGSKTFEILLKKDLLGKWQDEPTAKLRTLICRVALNVLSNDQRVQRGRQRLLKEHAASGDLDDRLTPSESMELSTEDVDAFYSSWVAEFLQQTVDRLMQRLHREGKGDYFRVLYSRLVENLSNQQVADVLQLGLATVENYYRAAKKQLAKELKNAVRGHVAKYTDEQAVSDEWNSEWQKLAEFLSDNGGLEQTVASCFDNYPEESSK